MKQSGIRWSLRAILPPYNDLLESDTAKIAHGPGGVQGWLERGLPGPLSNIADKRKRRVGVRVPWETSGPASILPCLISVIIGHGKNNAEGAVFR